MSALTILVYAAPDGGGYIARALDYSIYTEGAADELQEKVEEAINCHFGFIPSYTVRITSPPPHRHATPEQSFSA